ncbi:MAG TPA: SPOR domain-containing protein [Usitatibacter sp.]|nr:SPOR domain-containing protein [Usitatibacter sp.]
MPKDYKDPPASRGQVNHPLLLGVIIGLLLGIVISLAVALWLNRLANPFVEKNRSVEPLPKIGSAQPPPPPEAASAAQKAAQGSAPPEKGAKAPERPRFEFYQILPGEKEAPAVEAKAPAKAPEAAKPPVAPRPGSSPSVPLPHTGDVYWLQAGAFADEKEADNLRAKIALTGLEASVRAASVGDRGKLYRVRLGPYQSLDDANRIKATLSQSGVEAAIIRSADEAKNP